MVGTIEFKAELVSANLKVGGKCKTVFLTVIAAGYAGRFYRFTRLLPVQGGASLLLDSILLAKPLSCVTAC